MSEGFGFRPDVLLVAVVIVVAVCIQNLWLRRRAESEREDVEERPEVRRD